MAPSLLGGCDRQSGDDAQPQAEANGSPTALSGTIDRSKKGEPLPDFTVSDAEGETLALPSLKGTPLLVNLWATWCAPCVIELPMLDQLAKERAGNLRVLTISQDMTETEKVAPFLAERKLDRLEPWIDPENDLAFHYGTGTLPTTILYDAEGQEVWRYVGGHDWTTPETAEMLAEGLPE